MTDTLRDLFATRLQPAIDNRARDGAFSGTVRVARGDDAVFDGAWGYACRACRTPNQLETRFTTASVTKIFTATAILQLVEAGKLALDQTVGSVLPLAGTTIDAAVTVRQLLIHTSGIGDYFAEDEEDWPRAFLTTPTYTLRKVADFLPLFTGLPARFPPGARFGYCNAGYILLGRIVEVVSGDRFFDAVHASIFVPAGMTSAFFPTIDTLCDDLAEPYAVTAGDAGPQWRKCVSQYIPPAPDGGLAASAADLDRFWRALLGGQLLGEDVLAQMLAPQVEIRPGRHYGLGVYLISGEHGVQRYEAHGFDAGVNAYIAHYPALDVNAIVLSNIDSAATAVFRQLDALLAVQEP